MEKEIRKIIAKVFEMDPSELPDSFSQNELETWDSLRHLNLVVELESAFNVSYEPDEIGDMNSLEKIVDRTKGKLVAHD